MPDDLVVGVYHVDFLGLDPIVNFKRHYVLWNLTKPQLRHIIKNWDDVVVWDKIVERKVSYKGGYHPNTRPRKTLSSPIEYYLETNDDRNSKRVLYHGIGRDNIGLKALSQYGKNVVYGYDPYHPNELYRSLPSGLFDEVHSHYTLSAINRYDGKNVIKEIHDKLNSNGIAVMSVRRDLINKKK